MTLPDKNIIEAQGRLLKQYAEEVEALKNELHWLVQHPIKELSDDEIISYASKAGLLNYVDNETPRHYWIDDRNEVDDFVAFVQNMIAKSRKNCGD